MKNAAPPVALGAIVAATPALAEYPEKPEKMSVAYGAGGSNMFDVGLALAFGFIGFFMERWRYPAAPFVIALILGPILEVNFRRSMQISNWEMTILYPPAIVGSDRSGCGGYPISCLAASKIPRVNPWKWIPTEVKAGIRAPHSIWMYLGALTKSDALQPSRCLAEVLWGASLNGYCTKVRLSRRCGAYRRAIACSHSLRRAARRPGYFCPSTLSSSTLSVLKCL
ncbi:hypothetical protein [Ruegeria sp. MALMAid1280]|uniref:hypothetical protein n=1 Tax=Ruegeria sp. MALMAid1280 TaxID=3411634 RepID=UPI003BA2086C